MADGWTDGRPNEQMVGQTDKNDFIGRCPINVERPNGKHNYKTSVKR